METHHISVTETTPTPVAIKSEEISKPTLAVNIVSLGNGYQTPAEELQQSAIIFMKKNADNESADELDAISEARDEPLGIQTETPGAKALEAAADDALARVEHEIGVWILIGLYIRVALGDIGPFESDSFLPIIESCVPELVAALDGASLRILKLIVDLVIQKLPVRDVPDNDRGFLVSYYKALSKRQNFFAHMLARSFESLTPPPIEPEPSSIWVYIQDFISKPLQSDSLLEYSAGEIADAAILAWIKAPPLKEILLFSAFCSRPPTVPGWTLPPRVNCSSHWSIFTIFAGETHFLDVSESTEGQTTQTPFPTTVETHVTACESWTVDAFNVIITNANGVECRLEIGEGIWENDGSKSWTLRWQDHLGQLWGFSATEKSISLDRISNSKFKEIHWSFKGTDGIVSPNMDPSWTFMCGWLPSRTLPFSWTTTTQSSNIAMFFKPLISNIEIFNSTTLGDILAIFFPGNEVYQALFHRLPQPIAGFCSTTTRLSFSDIDVKYLHTPTGNLAIKRINIPIPLEEVADSNSLISLCGAQMSVSDLNLVIEIPGTEAAKLVLILSAETALRDSEMALQFEFELVGTRSRSVVVRIDECVSLLDLISLFPKASLHLLKIPFELETGNPSNNAINQMFDRTAETCAKTDSSHSMRMLDTSVLSRIVDNPAREPGQLYDPLHPFSLIQPKEESSSSKASMPSSIQLHHITISAPTSEMSAESGALRLAANAFWDRWKSIISKKILPSWTVEPVEISFSPRGNTSQKGEEDLEFEAKIKITIEVSSSGENSFSNAETEADYILSWGQDPEAGPREEDDITFDLDLSSEVEELEDDVRKAPVLPAPSRLYLTLNARYQHLHAGFSSDFTISPSSGGMISVAQMLGVMPVGNISKILADSSLPGIISMTKLHLRRFWSPVASPGETEEYARWTIEAEASTLSLLPRILAVENASVHIVNALENFSCTGHGFARIGKLRKLVEVSFEMPGPKKHGSIIIGSPLGLLLADLLEVFNLSGCGDFPLIGKVLDIELLRVEVAFRWDSISSTFKVAGLSCNIRAIDELVMDNLTLTQLTARLSYSKEACFHEIKDEHGENTDTYVFTATASTMEDNLDVFVDWNSCNELLIKARFQPTAPIDLPKIVGHFHNGLSWPPFPFLDQARFIEGRTCLSATGKELWTDMFESAFGDLFASSIDTLATQFEMELGDTHIIWQTRKLGILLKFGSSKSMTFLALLRLIIGPDIFDSIFSFLDDLLLDSGQIMITDHLRWFIPCINFRGPRMALSFSMTSIGDCDIKLAFEALEDVRSLELLAEVFPVSISTVPPLLSQLYFQNGTMSCVYSEQGVSVSGFTATLASSQFNANATLLQDCFELRVFPRNDLTAINVLELLRPGLGPIRLPLLQNLQFIKANMSVKMNGDIRFINWALKLSTPHLDVTLAAQEDTQAIVIKIKPTAPYTLTMIVADIVLPNTILGLESFCQKFNASIDSVTIVMKFDDCGVHLEAFDIIVSNESSINLHGIMLRAPRIQYRIRNDIIPPSRSGDTATDCGPDAHVGTATIPSTDNRNPDLPSCFFIGNVDIGADRMVLQISLPLNGPTAGSLAFSLVPLPGTSISTSSLCSLTGASASFLAEPKGFVFPSELQIEGILGSISLGNEGMIRIESLKAGVRLGRSLPLISTPKIQLSNPTLFLNYAEQRDLAFQLSAQLVIGEVSLRVAYSRGEDGSDWFTCEPETIAEAVPFNFSSLLDLVGLDVDSYVLPPVLVGRPSLEFDTLKLSLPQTGRLKLAVSGTTVWKMNIGGMSINLEQISVDLEFVPMADIVPMNCNISLSGDVCLGDIISRAKLELRTDRKPCLTATLQNPSNGVGNINLEAVLAGAGRITSSGDSMLPDALKSFEMDTIGLTLEADFENSSICLSGHFGDFGSGIFRRVPSTFGSHQSIIALSTKNAATLWPSLWSNIKTVVRDTEVALVILSHATKIPFLEALISEDPGMEIAKPYWPLIEFLQRKQRAEQLKNVGPGALIAASVRLAGSNPPTAAPFRTLTSTLEESPDAAMTLFANISPSPEDSIVEVSFQGLRLLGGCITLWGNGQYDFKNEKLTAYAFIKIKHETIEEPLKFRVNVTIDDRKVTFESPDDITFREPVVAHFKVMKRLEIRNIRVSGRTMASALRVDSASIPSPNPSSMVPQSLFLILQGEAHVGKHVATGSILLPGGKPKAAAIEFTPETKIPISEWIESLFGSKVDVPKMELSGLNMAYSLSNDIIKYEETGLELRPGYHVRATVTIFGKIFNTAIEMSEDGHGFTLTSTCDGAIDLGIVQLTPLAGPASQASAMGPMITLTKTSNAVDFQFHSGLTLFGCEGHSLRLSYKDSKFAGEATYKGWLFGIENPKFDLSFSESGECGTGDFTLLQNLPGKDLAEGIKSASTRDKGCKCGQLELPLDDAECNVRFSLRLPFADHRVSKELFKLFAKVSVGISIGKFSTTIDLGNLEVPIPFPISKESLPEALEQTTRKNLEKIGEQILRQKRKFAGLVGALIAKGLSKRTTEQLICRKVKSKELVKHAISTTLAVASVSGVAASAVSTAVGASLSLGTGAIGAFTGPIGTVFTTYLIASTAVRAITTPISIAMGTSGVGIKLGFLLTAPVRKTVKGVAGSVPLNDDDSTDSDTDGEGEDFASARDEMNRMYKQRETEILEDQRRQQATLQEVKKKIEGMLVLSGPPRLEYVVDDENRSCAMHVDWSAVLPKEEGFDFDDYQGFSWDVEIGPKDTPEGPITRTTVGETTWTSYPDEKYLQSRTMYAKVRARFTARCEDESEDFVASAWTTTYAHRLQMLNVPEEVHLTITKELKALVLEISPCISTTVTHRVQLISKLKNGTTGEIRETTVSEITLSGTKITIPLLSLNIIEPCDLLAKVSQVATDPSTNEADSFPIQSAETLEVRHCEMQTQSTLLGEELTLTCIAAEEIKGMLYAHKDRQWRTLDLFASPTSLLYLDEEAMKSELYLIPEPDYERGIIYLPYPIKPEALAVPIDAPIIQDSSFLSLEERRLHLSLLVDPPQLDHESIHYFVVTGLHKNTFDQGVHTFKSHPAENDKLNVKFVIDLHEPRPKSVSVCAIVVNDNGEHVRSKPSLEFPIHVPMGESAFPFHALLRADGSLLVSWVRTEASGIAWEKMKVAIFNSSGFDIENATVSFNEGQAVFRKDVMMNVKGTDILIRIFPTTPHTHGQLSFSSFHIPETWSATPPAQALPGADIVSPIGNFATIVCQYQSDLYTRIFFTADNGNIVQTYRKHKSKITSKAITFKHENWKVKYLRHSGNAIRGGSNIAATAYQGNGKEKWMELFWVGPKGKLECEISKDGGKHFEKFKFDREWNKEGIASMEKGGAVLTDTVAGRRYLCWITAKGGLQCIYRLSRTPVWTQPESVAPDGSVDIAAGGGMCWVCFGVLEVHAGLAFIAPDGAVKLAEYREHGSDDESNNGNSARWQVSEIADPGTANPSSAISAYLLHDKNASNMIFFASPDGALCGLYKNTSRRVWEPIRPFAASKTLHPRSNILLRETYNPGNLSRQQCIQVWYRGEDESLRCTEAWIKDNMFEKSQDVEGLVWSEREVLQGLDEVLRGRWVGAVDRGRSLRHESVGKARWVFGQRCDGRIEAVEIGV
ncbi:uncharacterized protein BDR25DRAFT_340918 [Lindgomyces ingoldianus]|uniref:Uncharacterized protein n=1 Tax=Lindgomyces ingoldianus TaxID=673940 RepID=A0ACB6R5B0_9PLEO|nr:uncharacterized protein BDR25DRAFT_340918 [Lindgomyces ingoldianus]KAF2474463.1 hypothetical protein BDR25DRAFT_340918 [Lindgomyces ingoldianus]